MNPQSTFGLNKLAIFSMGALGCLLGASPLRADLGFTAVAAGDASSTSAVLWTRAIDTNAPTPVSLVLSLGTNASFAGTVASLPCGTDLTRGGVCKLDLTNLQPDTRYYYQFSAGSLSSDVGTFKTAPNADAIVPVHFAFSGDADGRFRPYPLVASLNPNDFDFFIFLGDTIYETASGSPGTNNSPAAVSTDKTNATPAKLLVDYHRKYLENLLPVSTGPLSSLKNFFAAHGNYTLLDNHELGNKQYINGGAPAGGPIAGQPTGAGVDATNPAFDVNAATADAGYMNKSAGFQAVMQAYADYQPIHEQSISMPADPRTDGTRQLFFARSWGKNALFVNVDDRSYRDIRLKALVSGVLVDDTANYGNGTRADNPARTMLGTAQLAWLKQTLLDAQNSHIVWKIVAVSSPIDQIGPIPTGAAAATADDGGKSWMGGYRAERNDLMKFIADNHIVNVVFLTTDDHQNRINELDYNPDPTQPNTLARVPKCFSIVAGPIGAGGPDLITYHSFANVKALADALAAREIAAGLDPLGLDPVYFGLHGVFREGDPNADSLRQPIDFYSPDTFNYTSLDVSADGVTLAVTTYGINSYVQNTFPTEDAAGPVRPVLGFQIDADLQPPMIQSVTATPNVLWPPNHELIPVTVSVAATDNDGIASERIVDVSSNESVNGIGDGNTATDWQITGDLSLLLRAERSGNGSGRTYTITIEVTDLSGNAARQSTTVFVPLLLEP
jgi:phosphodiesterase/alkaline phosphatase D-like protein